MSTKIGVLCSGDGLELVALIQAIQSGQVPAEIKIVLCDTQNSEVLNLARASGYYAAFVPRGAYHANQDGYERRLVEMMQEVDVEAVVLAGFTRNLGHVLEESFPGKVFGRDLCPAALVAELESRFRGSLFTLV